MCADLIKSMLAKTSKTPMVRNGLSAIYIVDSEFVLIDRPNAWRTIFVQSYNVLYTFGDNCLARRSGFQLASCAEWASSVYRSAAPPCWQCDTFPPLSLPNAPAKSTTVRRRRQFDTSFANNVINYSFAWFHDADNRASLADRRVGQLNSRTDYRTNAAALPGSAVKATIGQSFTSATTC